MPFHFPGTFGSNDVFWTQVPYLAGALGFSICRGFPPRTPCGIAPCTSPRREIGGGGAVFCTPRLLVVTKLFCCGCAHAAVASAKIRQTLRIVFIKIPSARGVQILARPTGTPQYRSRWITLKRPFVCSTWKFWSCSGCGSG